MSAHCTSIKALLTFCYVTLRAKELTNHCSVHDPSQLQQACLQYAATVQVQLQKSQTIIILLDYNRFWFLPILDIR